MFSVSQLMGFKALEAGITLELKLTDAVFQINADASLLEQVLINVIKNAIEATPPTGLIEITTNTQLSLLEISNNGDPIPVEIEDKLFSPFFSNKTEDRVSA
ncbi:MAG: hypothetical protein IPL65_14530 [Lewinellaceae bacterium]|nr:hypothetical protein [Lewinellaceae bacterium]